MAGIFLAFFLTLIINYALFKTSGESISAYAFIILAMLLSFGVSLYFKYVIR